MKASSITIIIVQSAASERGAASIRLSIMHRRQVIPKLRHRADRTNRIKKKPVQEIVSINPALVFGKLRMFFLDFFVEFRQESKENFFQRIVNHKKHHLKTIRIVKPFLASPECPKIFILGH